MPIGFAAGAYVQPSVSLSISGGGTERKSPEETDYRFYSFELGGQLTGRAEAGIQADILPGIDAVQFNPTWLYPIQI